MNFNRKFLRSLDVQWMHFWDSAFYFIFIVFECQICFGLRTKKHEKETNKIAGALFAFIICGMSMIWCNQSFFIWCDFIVFQSNQIIKSFRWKQNFKRNHTSCNSVVRFGYLAIWIRVLSDRKSEFENNILHSMQTNKIISHAIHRQSTGLKPLLIQPIQISIITNMRCTLYIIIWYETDEVVLLRWSSVWALKPFQIPLHFPIKHFHSIP